MTSTVFFRKYLDILNEAPEMPDSNSLSKATYTPDNIAKVQQGLQRTSEVPAGEVERVPGKDFTASNMEIVKKLVDPAAIKNFADQTVKFGQAPYDKAQALDDIKNITQWEDPQGIIKVALNTGITVDEIVAAIPKDFNLKARPYGFQSKGSQDLLKL